MCHLDDEVAAAEEQQPHTPVGVAAIEAKVEAEASRIQRYRPLGMGRADHHMVEP